MFGYVTADYQALSAEDQEQYRQYYCGLCRALESRHGSISRLTLNNDMTFLLILLSSLYEPQEHAGKGRCLTHPLKARAYVCSDLCAYCADMTVLLAYYKALDDRTDDHSLRGKVGAAALQKPFARVREQYPDKVGRIAGYISAINAYETEGGEDIDVPVNLSGKMLGEVFRYRDDAWGDDLQALGEGLGRFVYLMDAYDDLASDLKKGRFNALRNFHGDSDFEAFCEDTLLMLIAECTSVFETLPLEKHLPILRNVLYSGVWMKYRLKTGKAKRKQNRNKETDHESKPV